MFNLKKREIFLFSIPEQSLKNVKFNIVLIQISKIDFGKKFNELNVQNRIDSQVFDFL